VNNLSLENYDYVLPERLIAQQPAGQRDQSRLMVLEANGERRHTVFEQVHQHFHQGDLLVINEAKVTAFCLDGVKVGSSTAVTCLITEKRHPEQQVYRALAKPLRRLKPGAEIIFDDLVHGLVLERDRFTCTLRLQSLDPAIPIETALRRVARPPLPPYIKRPSVGTETNSADHLRYQTVYARVEGSIAAPTAGLHFSPALLEKIRGQGVKVCPLHLKIGAGTFRPVKTANIVDHQMEEEHYEIDETVWHVIRQGCQDGQRLFAVGTTVIRALEAIMQSFESGRLQLRGSTTLFIYPGYRFRLPYSGLITNFHLPRSTLFMLVCAFYGADRIKAAYSDAVDHEYRFYSYGDAMFIKSVNGIGRE